MKVVLGDVLVEKVSSNDEERQRLREEAATLRAVAHPGVVSLVSATDGRISLRRVHGRDLRAVPTQAPHVTAAWGAALCTTVGDLHGIGCVHAAITAEHVILDADGHPVLCGFGSARWPRDPIELHRLARLDRRAVASLIEDRLVDYLPRRSSIKGRGCVRITRVRKATNRSVDRALSRMLEDASGGRDESWLRELARRLSKYSRSSQADTVGAAGPPGRMPSGDSVEEGPSSARSGGGQVETRLPSAPGALRARVRAKPQGKFVGLALVAAVVMGLVVRVTVWGRTDPQSRTANSARTVTVVGPSGPLELSTSSAGPLSLTSGRWTCSKVMPALLDQGSGNIWAFPAWPGPGGVARGRMIAHVPGAVALRSIPSRHDCDILAATTRSGSLVTLKVGDSP